MGGAWDVGPVLSADVSGGLNMAPGGRCVQWDSASEDPSADYPCSKEDSVAVVGVVGARVGAQMGLVDVATVFRLDLGGSRRVIWGWCCRWRSTFEG